ncbi:hypothetical protein Dimus_037710, partial [Dionaea muscipula]
DYNECTFMHSSGTRMEEAAGREPCSLAAHLYCPRGAPLLASSIYSTAPTLEPRPVSRGAARGWRGLVAEELPVAAYHRSCVKSAARYCYYRRSGDDRRPLQPIAARVGRDAHEPCFSPSEALATHPRAPLLAEL